MLPNGRILEEWPVCRTDCGHKEWFISSIGLLLYEKSADQCRAAAVSDLEYLFKKLSWK